MCSTSILMFHPDPARSRTNASLAAKAGALPGVCVIDMAARHPAGQVEDVDSDVALLLRADRIVLQFPVQWYSTPPLLKAWQDAVLTQMFYINPETEGAGLEGKPLLVAATAGNVPEAYAPDGMNLFPLEHLLAPLQATAHRCGLVWSAPFLLYRADKLDDAERAAAADAYCAHLSRWIAATSQQR